MHNGEIKLELTRRGKWEAAIRSKGLESARKTWDEQWRIVIFDIPITKSKTRAELRRAMALHGFKLLQQSVWVYPYPCDDFIEIVKSHLNIAADVLYIKANYIENDRHLRREFKL